MLVLQRPVQFFKCICPEHFTAFAVSVIPKAIKLNYSTCPIQDVWFTCLPSFVLTISLEDFSFSWNYRPSVSIYVLNTLLPDKTILFYIHRLFSVPFSLYILHRKFFLYFNFYILHCFLKKMSLQYSFAIYLLWTFTMFPIHYSTHYDTLYGDTLYYCFCFVLYVPWQ